MAELESVQTKDGGTVQIDTQTQIYDPFRDEVRAKAKSPSQLIAELASRLEAAEARIAALESAAKV